MSAFLLAWCRLPYALGSPPRDEAQAWSVVARRIAELTDDRLRRVFEDMTGALSMRPDAGDADLDAEVGEPWRDHVRSYLLGAAEAVSGENPEVAVVTLDMARYAMSGGLQVDDGAPTDAYDQINRLAMSGVTDEPLDADQVERLVELAEALGVDPSDLDDAVHELKGNEAADIDNGGLDSQIAYLLTGDLPEGIEARLRALAQ